MKKLLTIIALYCSLSLLNAQKSELHLDIGASKMRVNMFNFIDYDGYLYSRYSPMISLKYQYIFKNHLGTYIDISYSNHHIDTKRYYDFFNMEILDGYSPIQSYASTLGLIYRFNIFNKLSFDMNIGIGYNFMDRYNFEINNPRNTFNIDNLYSFTALKSYGWVSKSNFNFNYMIYKSNIHLKAGYQVATFYQKLLKSIGVIDINFNRTEKFLVRNRVDYIFNNFYLGLFVKL